MHTPAGLPAKGCSVNESTCTIGWRFIVSPLKVRTPRASYARARVKSNAFYRSKRSVQFMDISEMSWETAGMTKLFSFFHPHYRQLISIISIEPRVNCNLPARPYMILDLSARAHHH